MSQSSRPCKKKRKKATSEPFAYGPSLQKLPNRIRISGDVAAGGSYSDPRTGELLFATAQSLLRSLLFCNIARDRKDRGHTPIRGELGHVAYFKILCSLGRTE